MIKKDHIKKALGITHLAYDNTIDAHFGIWCEKYAIRLAVPLRALLTNEKLYSWYRDQWLQKVELPFYCENREYLEAGVEDIDGFHQLLLSYTKDILDIYPSPILKRIGNRYKKWQLQKV